MGGYGVDDGAMRVRQRMAMAGQCLRLMVMKVKRRTTMRIMTGRMMMLLASVMMVMMRTMMRPRTRMMMVAVPMIT
eukprot:6289126-Pyramimonas_sp.AAC.1